MAINTWTGAGRLTRDVEHRTTQGGKSVATFALAVDDPFDKDNPLFIKCTAFQQLADLCQKYLSKGKYVVVTGTLKLERWEKDGNKNQMIACILRDLDLGPKQDAAPRQETREEPPRQPERRGAYGEPLPPRATDEDLPF